MTDKEAPLIVNSSVRVHSSLRGVQLQLAALPEISIQLCWYPCHLSCHLSSAAFRVKAPIATSLKLKEASWRSQGTQPKSPRRYAVPAQKPTYAPSTTRCVLHEHMASCGCPHFTLLSTPFNH